MTLAIVQHDVQKREHVFGSKKARHQPINANLARTIKNNKACFMAAD